MPPPAAGTLPLRIIIEEPLADVALALQHGSAGLEPPTTRSSTHAVFDFSVRVGAQQADGTPNFLGAFAQGPAASRFVYVCVGRRAGQANSPCDGRMKIPLTGITQDQVAAALSKPGLRLSVRVPGRNQKGGPNLATVRLAVDAWLLEASGGFR